MKIGIIGDAHLGFYRKNKLKEDSFTMFEKAIKKASEISDVIIILGDLFEKNNPSLETIKKAINILKIPKGKEKTATIKKNEKTITWRGIPVFAIAGNHEYKSKGFINPIEILEEAGLLIYLNGESVELEDVHVYGFSSVPEKKAKEVLQILNPKPKEGMTNIFIMHQGIKEVVGKFEATISISDLPKGFDAYFLGHIHEREIFENPLVALPGSLIPTKIKGKEAEQEKGFFLFDTTTKELRFIKIDGRKYFVFEKEVKNREELEKTIEEIKEFAKKYEEPVIRLILKIPEEKEGLFNTKEIEEMLSPYCVAFVEKNRKGESRIEIDVKKEEFEDISTLGEKILLDVLRKKGFKYTFDPLEVFNEMELKKGVEIAEKIEKSLFKP